MHRPTRLTRLSLPVTLTALLLVASAVTRIDASARAGSASSAPVAHSGPAAPAASLSPATTATRILTTAEGRTLYVFAPDKPNQSVCTGACAQFWPPLLLPAGKAIPTSAPGAGGTFGVTTRADGTRQLTYDGAPLYTFVKDKLPGDLAGQGVEGIWWAVVGAALPQANPLIATAPARVWTDARGRTLYLFTPDKANKSNCSGQCAQFWPPLIMPAGAALPAGPPDLGGTFGLAARPDGTHQLSYDGAPLYTFVKDKQPGDMTGQGVEGIWWAMVASPAASATPAPAASTTGGSDASGLTWDTTTQTANLTLETSHDGTHNGFNFNGYAMGGLVISIPVNYRVNVTLRNKGPFPHSAVITDYANRSNAVVFPPAFDGASSAAPLQGNPAGSVQTFSFIASQTGTYALVCAVSRHAEFGMWDTFIVTRGGAPRITPMTM